MNHLHPKSFTFQLLKKIESFLYAEADLIVVLTNGVKAALEKTGVPSARIIYVPNASDPLDFTTSSSREELREKYGFTKRTAVYAGAHGPANGLELLVDAASKVQSLDIQVVLVGDGLLKEHLVADVARRAIRNVSFMPAIPKSEMPELLRSADIGLHVLMEAAVFAYGVSPNKLFDYMAAGLPTLTNVRGEVGDLVLASGCGWVVDSSGLDKGLVAWAQSSAQDLAQKGARAREYMRSNQTRSITAQTLLQALNSLVATP